MSGSPPDHTPYLLREGVVYTRAAEATARYRWVRNSGVGPTALLPLADVLADLLDEACYEAAWGEFRRAPASRAHRACVNEFWDGPDARALLGLLSRATVSAILSDIYRFLGEVASGKDGLVIDASAPKDPYNMAITDAALSWAADASLFHALEDARRFASEDEQWTDVGPEQPDETE